MSNFVINQYKRLSAKCAEQEKATSGLQDKLKARQGELDGCKIIIKQLEEEKAGLQLLSKQYRETLEANHQWHKDYDEYGGYPESDLCEQNTKALATTSPTEALERYRDEVLKNELSRDVLWQIDRKAFIKIMVDKFLCWKLPEHFNPDCGIVFTKRHSIGTQFESNYEPVGTNLFSASQAEEMFDHCFPDTVEVNERRMKKG